MNDWLNRFAETNPEAFKSIAGNIGLLLGFGIALILFKLAIYFRIL